MGERTIYFESDNIRAILDNASENINTFRAQTTVTKAELADDLHINTVIYETTVAILLDTLDAVQVQNEGKDKVIKKWKTNFILKIKILLGKKK